MSTPLDEALYAWLAERDARRFERAFARYFALAFPAVVRHLARVCRWDSAHLEEIAQDALIRFFDRVGRRRREAAAAVREELARMKPLELGALHARQVEAWKEQVGSFRQESLGFRVPDALGGHGPDWKETIRLLAARIPELQRQGCRLLLAVQAALHWRVAAGEGEGEREGLHTLELSDLLHSVARLVEEATTGSAQALDADVRQPGARAFISSGDRVIDAVPQLRLPTNGFLFEIAMNLYLDECKKRASIKRGGSGRRDEPEAETGTLRDGAPHPLEAMEDNAGPDAGVAGFWQTAAEPSVADASLRLQHQDFLEKFYAWLRSPLDAAAAECARAMALGKGMKERERLEALQHKFDRMMAVLTLLGEGHTQEESAEQLGLSRNQIKYIVRLVQEAHERFEEHPRRPEIYAHG